MSLYRRPRSPYWWCKFEVRGVTVRRSTGETSRAKAEAAQAALREQFKDRQHGIGHTWSEAFSRWLDERAAKRSLAKDGEIIAWLRPRIGKRRLDDTTRDDIEGLRHALRRTRSPATTNRYMALVRSILRAAVHDWEWLRRAPKVAMYKLEQPEPRWITEDEFRRLVDALMGNRTFRRGKKKPAKPHPEIPKAPHLARMARFAVHTGLRRANVTGLRWSDVDLRRRHVTVAGREAKGKRGIAVPLDADAMAVLEECRGHHPTYVFVFEGQPVEQVSTRAWREATKAAGIPGFRFHDLRHTWASWHVQRGTSLAELQALGGWRSLAMVQRYAHLSSTSLRAAADRLDGVGSGTPAGHTQKAANGD
jgi:integrase